MTRRLILALPLAGAITMLLALMMLGALNYPVAWSGSEDQTKEPRIIGLHEFDRWIWITCGCSPIRPVMPEKEQIGDVFDTPDEPTLDNTDPALEDLDLSPPRRVFNAEDVEIWDGFVPPRNWGHCLAEAPTGGRVQARFDVSPAGETENVEVIFSTHPCFEPSVRRSVEQSTYPPLIRNGEPAWQYGRTVSIVFAPE